MKENKMHLINKIFNNETIRTIWDKDDEKYREGLKTLGYENVTTYNGEGQLPSPKPGVTISGNIQYDYKSLKQFKVKYLYKGDGKGTKRLVDFVFWVLHLNNTPCVFVRGVSVFVIKRHRNNVTF